MVFISSFKLTSMQQFNKVDQYVTDINKELIDQRIRRTIRKEGNSIRIELVNPDDFNATRRIVRELDNLVAFENVSTQSQAAVLVTMTDDRIETKKRFCDSTKYVDHEKSGQ